MATLNHTITHHFHGPVAAIIYYHERAQMLRLYPAGAPAYRASVDIYLHNATEQQIAAFRALAYALNAQDAPAEECVA